MLNKELLLTTESQIAGHIKLTVGEDTTEEAFGWFLNNNVGSINRIPTWNKNGDPIKIYLLLAYPEDHYTTMIFYKALKVDADSITMTVVEKKLTVVLRWYDFYYKAQSEVFDPSDRGKTFTIVFDPEPTGYV